MRSVVMDVELLTHKKETFKNQETMASKQAINKQIEQVANIIENNGSLKNGLNVCEANLKNSNDNVLSNSEKMLFTTFKLLLQLKNGDVSKFNEIRDSFQTDVYMNGDNNKLIKSVPSDSMSLNWIKKLSLQLMKYDEFYKIVELSNFKNRSFEKLMASFIDSLEVSSMQNLFKNSSILCMLTKKDLVHGRNFHFWNAVVALTTHKFSNRCDSQKDNSSSSISWIDYHEISNNLENLKPFQSDQERIIYCQICEVHGESASKLKIYKEIEPLITEQNGNIDLYLKNLIINNCENSEDLLKVCIRLLENLNDYDILMKLIGCCFSNLQTPKNKVYDILLSNEKFKESRNFLLGFLEIDSLYNENHCIEQEHIQKYLEFAYNKSCCYIDLQRFIEKDSTLLTKIEEIMNKWNTIKDPIYHFNMYKLFPKSHNGENLERYCEYVIDQVYHTMLETPHQDLIKTTIKSCDKINKQLSETPNEYILHLWLVVLYTSLGFLPLATKHYYDFLKIKNVQIDVLDHLIYSRQSSIWPQKDVILGIDDKIYQSMENMPRFIDIAFDRKSYSKISGMVEFYNELKMSFNRWRKYTDVLIVSRLFNDTKLRKDFIVDLQELFEFNHNYTGVYQANNISKDKGLKFSDNRDFHTLFFNEHDVKNIDKLPEFMNYCKLDNKTYIQYVFLKELSIMKFQENHTDKYDHYIDHLKSSSECASDDKDMLENLTDVEKWSFELIMLLSERQGEALEQQLLTKLNNIPDFHNSAFSENGWYHSHYISTIMTTLKTLDTLKKLSPAIKSKNKSVLQEYRKIGASEIFQSYTEKINAIDDKDVSNEYKKLMLEQVTKLSKICKSL